jgi:hypothetical protein
MVLLLFAVLSVCLYRDYLPHNILYSNDGPLGELTAQCHRLPDRFTGCWEDLHLLGFRDWGTAPSISFGLQYLLKPVLFSKLYAPAALLILGLGAWCFFRESGLTPAACLLGGLAATLNSSFFSAACWGVASHAIAIGMIFFALAALVGPSSRRRWLRVVLAGLAVGMSVTEGADIGALFSLYLAAFVVYQAWLAEGSRARSVAVGFGRLALVAGCAAWLAAAAISGLVDTEIKGVVGTKQDAQTKQERWDWATQFSLPKWETFGLVVPGLFGYRMDTPDGGEYWGTIGRHAVWDRYFQDGRQGSPPTKPLRFSGGGGYVGVLVLLLAVWAAVQSLRRKDSVFSLRQRKLLWFWLGIGLISLLMGYGRFAPFYRLVYALPYASTVRNPVKFLHVLSLSLVVLFAYGVDGLWRRYMQPAGPNTAPQSAELKVWWARATRFEKRWVAGCVLALGASLLAWLVYASSRGALEQYLQTVLFDETKARAIAGFSISQVGWFVFFFVLAASLMLLIFSGRFAGTRAKWGWGLLGLLLVVDLGRANQPWVIYWDYQEKYASNPIIDRLREKPYEQRVAIWPFGTPPELSVLGRLYRGPWIVHQFPYYNVQSLDTVQVPRMPEDLLAFEKALTAQGVTNILRVTVRAWQLTNTRYLLGPAEFFRSLNLQSDPVHSPFRIAERFTIVSKPEVTEAPRLDQVTAVADTNGPYALFEFTQALPRAKLYTNWEIRTNDQAVLDQLAAAAFDPERSVFVAGGLPPARPTAGTNDNAGTVAFASYAPKDIVLRSDAHAPSVLLLNDRFDPNWKVRVDGTPAKLLRCNYIMRGVYLAPGAHTVEFRFQPPLGPLCISLAAIGVGLLALGFVVVAGRRSDSLIPAPTSPPQPAQSRPGRQPAPDPASGAFKPSPQPAIAHSSSAGTGTGKRARKAR